MSITIVDDTAVAAALTAMAPADILVGHRVIGATDADALLDSERAAFDHSVATVRNQSGAARLVARRLAAMLGVSDLALPRTASRAALWPAGLVGSLAHDDAVAIAAVARAEHYAGIGIDVEPALPLRAGVLRFIATPNEQARYAPAVLQSRLLFVIKEAVYKAQSALDRERLDFRDVEVDLDTRIAHTPVRRIEFRYREQPRVLALAFVPAAPALASR